MRIEAGKLLDFEQVSALAREIQAQHREYFPDLYVEEDLPIPFHAFTDMVSAGQLVVIREKEAGELRGYLSFEILENNFHGFVARKVLMIHMLKIADGYEGRGYGTALMEYMEGWGKEQGCNFMDLMVNPKNENALRFYKRFGFCGKQLSCYKHL